MKTYALMSPKDLDHFWSLTDEKYWAKLLFENLLRTRWLSIGFAQSVLDREREENQGTHGFGNMRFLRIPEGRLGIRHGPLGEYKEVQRNLDEKNSSAFDVLINHQTVGYSYFDNIIGKWVDVHILIGGFPGYEYVKLAYVDIVLGPVEGYPGLFHSVQLAGNSHSGFWRATREVMDATAFQNQVRRIAAKDHPFAQDSTLRDQAKIWGSRKLGRKDED